MKRKRILAGLTAFGITAAFPVAAQAFTFTPPDPVSAGTVETNLDSGATQDTSFTPVSTDTVGTETRAAEMGQALTVTGTGVFLSEGGFVNGNYQGYLSIALDDNDDDIFDRQCLIDRYGNILMTSTYSAYYYEIYDDVISFGPGNEAYLPEGWDDSTAPAPEFYHMDGSRLFEQVTVPAELGLPLAASLDPSAIAYSTPMVGGYALVWLEGYEGALFMDKTGTITYVYDKPEEYVPELGGWKTGAQTFGDNGWTACHENFVDVVMGYKDGHGQDVLQFDTADDALWFENCFPFYDGLSVVGWGNEYEDWKGMWGAVDTSGNLVIPQVYEVLSNWGNSDGMLSAEIGGKWGFIDRNNQTIIPLIYDFADGWSEGIGVVGVLENGKLKYGMVDRNNQLLVPCEYDVITRFQNGVAYGFKNSEVDKQLYLITRIGN